MLTQTYIPGGGGGATNDIYDLQPSAKINPFKVSDKDGNTVRCQI